MPALKTNASAIHTMLQVSASLTLTSCALRWNTPRSSATIPRTKTLNATHSQIEPIVSKQFDPPTRAAVRQIGTSHVTYRDNRGIRRNGMAELSPHALLLELSQRI